MRATFLGLILFLIPDWNTKAQNLVPNPGFELYNTCPKALANVRDVMEWIPATAGTPDYYNHCDVNGYSRFVQPHSGSGCLGLIVLNGYEEFSEYIQVTLTDTLVPGTDYCVQFHVKSANETVEIDQLGLAFLEAPIQKDFITRLTLKPDVVSPRGQIISSYLNWHRVAGNYIAKGGESTIILGSFNPAEMLTVAPIEGAARSQAWNCYYLFDDVAVFERKPGTSCEMAWTPPIVALEETHKTSDNPSVFPQLSPVYFDVNQAALDVTDSVLILQVVRVLTTNENWQLELTGHTDSDASAAYNQHLAAQRCQAVLDLLLQQGVDKHRVTSVSKGESMPAFENDTEQHKAANRRVEFIFR